MRNKLFVSASLAFAAIGVAFAQFGVRDITFTEVPGELEFSGEMIVRPLQPEADGTLRLSNSARRALAGNLLVGQIREYVPQTDEYIVRVPIGHTETSYARQLMSTGLYQYAEPNWICYPNAIPNDPRYNLQWHHPIVQSPQAWDIETGSNDIITAFVDTGILKTHADLAANVVEGYNSVNRLKESEGGQINDINGHGTHVAGCGSAIGNNGVGVSGMGWNFKIMMVRTSNSSGGSASMDNILHGSRWAAENGAKVVSASYSGVNSSAVGTTGTYIKSIGSLFCYAAGNSNSNLTGAKYPDTIVVGASNQNDGKASFSSYGNRVTLFAPGVDIQSTLRTGGYGNMSGTSMATPVVNGAIAMIWSVNPALTAQQVQDILEDTCDNIGSAAIFGAGRINQFKAVQAAYATRFASSVPNSYTLNRGNLLAGNLASLVASDGNLFSVGAGIVVSSQESPIDLTVRSTSPWDDASEISVVVENKASLSNIERTVSAFNYATNSWTVVWVDSPNTNMQSISIPLPGDVSNFIAGNRQMQVNVKYRPAGPIVSSSWSIDIDQVGWNLVAP